MINIQSPHNSKILLSVLILTKNEEGFIKDCLESVHNWADEIIIVDSGSTDQTLTIAKKYLPQIYQSPPGGNYQIWRNFALSKSHGEWIFYLDADERITEELKHEITQTITSNPQYHAYAIPRLNYLLGIEMRHGGWTPDYVKRIYRKSAFSGWRGELHEEPIYEGELGLLTQTITHIQPDTLEPMLEKSIKWSGVEARLLLEANHPPIVWWRILRMGLTTLWQRLIKKQGYLDGPEGTILAIYQAYHTMIIYMKLWEMQISQQKLKTKN